MASETGTPEIVSFLERLLRHRDMSLFLPFVLGFTGNVTTRENLENPELETPQTATTSSERIILINPFTQGMVVIGGTSGLDSLLRNFSNKDGQPPASKSSIEAMRIFKIGEGENEEICGDCVICLEEYVVGETAREMPCKHKFHANCIEKWLGIHGSCPVCRYQMPVEEGEVGNKRDEQRSQIWVSFSFHSDRSGGDSNQNEPTTTSGDSSDVSSSPIASPDQGTDN